MLQCSSSLLFVVVGVVVVIAVVVGVSVLHLFLFSSLLSAIVA